MCSFCVIVGFFISTQLFHVLSVWRPQKMPCCLAGRRQQQSSPADLAACEQLSGSRQGVGRNGWPDGWAETHPFPGPHWCGQCRENAENGERFVPAENSTTAEGQRTMHVPCQWIPSFCGCNAALHNGRINLQRAGCRTSSISCTWHSPAAPGTHAILCVSLTGPYAVKFTHPNCYSSLATWGALTVWPGIYLKD